MRWACRCSIGTTRRRSVWSRSPRSESGRAPTPRCSRRSTCAVRTPSNRPRVRRCCNDSAWDRVGRADDGRPRRRADALRGRDVRERGVERGRVPRRDRRHPIAGLLRRGRRRRRVARVGRCPGDRRQRRGAHRRRHPGRSAARYRPPDAPDPAWGSNGPGRPRSLPRGASGQRGRAPAVRGGRIRPCGTAARLLRCRSRGRGGHAQGAAAVTSAIVTGSPAEALVLGIETSCDETGVGLVRGRTLLADAVASSVDEHARFGGVVPEVASRAHLQALLPTAHRAFATAGLTPSDIDAVAVTAGPGLSGALLVGVAAAKAYALALDKPLYAVNHLSAHVAVDLLGNGPLDEPCVALLVSGGHSSLLLVPRIGGEEVIELGATVDDAAGEAFDKVARLLGLPFPGGPPIDRAAREGDPAAIAFPRGLTGPRDAAFDFSFSGLKTAVARWVEAREQAGEPVPVADVAASFQEAVADVLTAKAVRACRDHGVDHLVLGGGVAANSRLRALAEERCAAAVIVLRVPSPRLCTDNGARVAALGSRLVAAGVAPSAPDLGADSSLPIEVVSR